MSALNIVLGIVLMLAAIFLIVAVLLQGKSSKGLSGAIGGGNADTYYGRNKNNSKQKKLSRLTMIVAIVFAVLVLVMFLFT
ncbi:MAG: preprotein translocase subunit SecG [Clostridia bacterium]|nr:preprotein translocase subunit SecG [Clostridia bacterium]